MLFFSFRMKKLEYFCILIQPSMHYRKRHIIKAIHPSGILRALLVFLFLATGITAEAQHSSRNGFTILNCSNDRIDFEFNMQDISAADMNESYSLLSSTATNGANRDAGKPMIPIFQQLFSIPRDAQISIEITEEEWETLSLQELSAEKMLCPAPMPTVKSADTIIFDPDESCYSSDRFYQLPLVRLATLGTMRNLTAGRLTIAPVRYNPVRHKLQVCRHIAGSVRFTGTSALNTSIRPLSQSVISLADTKAYNNHEQADGDRVIVSVAPEIFRESLQPLFSWKRQEGYVVEELYVNGETQDEIKTFLQNRFDYSTPSHPAPQYILLTGDVQEIPIWLPRHRIAGLDGHRTDLYYAEFTGDYLPDAAVGRISAHDTATLNRIIEKTLAYERFSTDSSDYLNRSLIVAGKELTPPAPTATNGQVNYIKQRITAHSPTHDTICYYNPSSDSLGQEIYDTMRNGVGLVNYTAHCSYLGWRYPTLTTIDVDTLQENRRYFLSINNCCRSNEILGDCLGEHLLRKANGGAIGVIGATNETLWEEDFCWAVGSRNSSTLFPSYDSTSLGAYDRLLHANNERPSEYAATQGLMLQAGNWAVTCSDSPYDAFYWEIYLLLGDPTLMPYVGAPSPISLSAETTVAGDSYITLHGTPGARVAATRRDTLYGTCILDTQGNGTIACRRPITDTMLLTATAQFHSPKQILAVPSVATAPRLVAESCILTNLDGSSTLGGITMRDSALLAIKIRNIGPSTAINHHFSVTPLENGDAAILQPASFEFDSLPSNGDTLVTILVSPLISNPTLPLMLASADSIQRWHQPLNIDILTPRMEVTSATLFSNGSETTVVSPSSNYDFNLTLKNKGTGTAYDLEILLLNSDSTIFAGSMQPSDSIRCTFNVPTPESRDSLVLHLVVRHRTDSAEFIFAYAPDSTVNTIQADEESHFAIFPNPAKESVTFSGFSQPTHIAIYDLYGRLTKEFDAQNGDIIQYSLQELRCSGHGRGVFCVVFTENNGNGPTRTTVQKLVTVR